MTFTLLQGHDSPEGKQRYTSSLSLTSALNGVGGQRHAPVALPPGRNPSNRSLNVSSVRSGQVRNISLPPGSDPRILQSIANRYIVSAIQIHECVLDKHVNVCHYIYICVCVCVCVSHCR
jgi:hypothetical protein